MIVAYDYTGLIATYLVPYGRTVDQHVYVHFLCKILRSKVWRLYSQMLDCTIILHDDTRPHIAMLVTTVFQEYGWEVLNHPLYSPDLSPLDYDLFPKRKEQLRGICFSNLSEPSSVMTWEVRQLNKNQLLHKNFLKMLKLTKIYIKFSQKWPTFFSKFQQIFKIDQFFLNFHNIFLIIFQTFPVISSIFLCIFIFSRL